jgi:hypothetical protein
MSRQPLRNSLGVKIWSPVSEGGYHRKHQIGYKWVIQKWDIAEGTPKCGPRLGNFCCNEIDSVLRQDQMQEGEILLVLKVVADKTSLSGRGELTCSSGVLRSAPSSFRKRIDPETAIEHKGDRRIRKRRKLNWI